MLNILKIIKQCLLKSLRNSFYKKYNKIWEKIEELLNVKFESKPVYGDDEKYIKTKIKSYRDKVDTNSQDKKVPKKKFIIEMFVNNNFRVYY